ncbi:MAG: hypothetical protein FWD93_00455, partial [Coriobacteriia bacterium]|nr:hypothetical protein [Coriobacteriia bacterium]
FVLMVLYHPNCFLADFFGISFLCHDSILSDLESPEKAGGFNTRISLVSYPGLSMNFVMPVCMLSKAHSLAFAGQSEGLTTSVFVTLCDYFALSVLGVAGGFCAPEP